MVESDYTLLSLKAIMETGKYFKVEPIILEGVAHDCMLDTRWPQVAAKLDTWLQTFA